MSRRCQRRRLADCRFAQKHDEDGGHPDDYFVTATVPWFHEQGIKVLAGVALSVGIHHWPSLLNASQLAGETTERVVRWDRRAPDEIFETGFVPRLAGRMPVFSSFYFGLRDYVLENRASIYVSAVRYQGANSAGARLRWRPDLGRVGADEVYYEYEIVVPRRCEVDVTARCSWRSSLSCRCRG